MAVLIREDTCVWGFPVLLESGGQCCREVLDLEATVRSVIEQTSSY
jgi:hypothetical protein